MASNLAAELFATSDAEEEHLLQLAIEASLSMGQKRKPEAAQLDEPQLGSKRSRLSNPTPSSLKPAEAASAAGPTSILLAFPNGALRITRTSSRSKSNSETISLPDIIDKNALVSAIVYAFFIAEDEFLPYLPVGNVTRDVPVFIGRDIHMDPMVDVVAASHSVALRRDKGGKLNKESFEKLRPVLADHYTKEYGANYRAFYAKCGGCAHSKVMALEYPDFLRIVITSANMLSEDCELGDNSWYIHDLPLREARATAECGFERRFFDHLLTLGGPVAHISKLRRKFDFSKVLVYLITSEPRMSPSSGDLINLDRLKEVTKELDARPNNTSLEICTGSVGNLQPGWLSSFFGACTGGAAAVADPSITVVFPSRGDAAHWKYGTGVAGHGPANIGSHIQGWYDADRGVVRRMFAHYKSRDAGCMFHLKLYLALDRSDLTARPHWVYVGSANFSASAWGTLAAPGSSRKAPNNFECGVVVPGELLRRLRPQEQRSASWDVNVVPYVRPPQKYRNEPCQESCGMRAGTFGTFMWHHEACSMRDERPYTLNVHQLQS